MDSRILQIFLVIITMHYLVESQIIKDDVVFAKIGTYLQRNFEKTYWVPRYIKAQSYLARSICKAYGFDILTIGTLEEFQNITGSCVANKNLFGSYTHIGAVVATPRSSTDWYWVTTNEKVSYDMPWTKGQPDFGNNNEYCLSISTHNGFTFDDIPCEGSWKEKFICESVRHLNEEM